MENCELKLRKYALKLEETIKCLDKTRSEVKSLLDNASQEYDKNLSEYFRIKAQLDRDEKYKTRKTEIHPPERHHHLEKEDHAYMIASLLLGSSLNDLYRTFPEIKPENGVANQ